MRDKITIYTSVLLMLIGSLTGIGVFSEFSWEWLVFVPFTWIFVGTPLDWLINGKNDTKTSGYFSMLSAYVVANIALIIFHRETSFIIGRLILCIGYVLISIRLCRNSVV